MLKLPYAIRDFFALITENYLYFDRTDRIPLLEDAGKELLFLRPRRYGKSLWLSTLMNYYDVAKSNDFERLFGDFSVGKNPTPLHNKFLVMKWDFSTVESHGTIHEIRTSLYNHINEQIAIFADDYPTLLSSTIRINPDDALASFYSVIAAVRRSPYKFYLFIDEYDNFANEVMMGRQRDNRKRYDELVSGEGLLKTLFKNIKAAGSGDGMDRVFITGVSPVVMNDLTSGANVNEDITWLPYFNDLCGFTAAEVRSLVDRMVDEGQMPANKVEEALEQMRLFYNGSRFVTHFPGGKVSDASMVYNPILTFHFLRNIQRFGEYPQNMLDSNMAPDYNKLVYISAHAKGEQLLTDVLGEETAVTVSDLDDRWGVQELLNPEQQSERLATLLCYLGALTIADKQADSQIVLGIPNLVMRRLYAERILKLTFRTANELDEAKIVANTFFAQGDIVPLCTFIEKNLLTIYDNRDYQHFNELTLKTLFMALLHFNNLYIMDSEPTLQRRYGDLIMMIRPEMRHYSVFDLLIEFKHVSLGDAKLTGKGIQDTDPSELASLPMVKKELANAREQLQDYRKTLKQKYGQALKLRTYAVVSVGFERLVWQEVSP
ncbi:MAG: AAA family ATPase [Chloroflexota bacterium]